jgi:hypothetical protein
MTKARNLSKIIDGSGNLVVPNAGANAKSLGIVDSTGAPISSLDRTTTYGTSINTGTPYAGIIPVGNCAGATNALDIDPNYNTTTAFIAADGKTTNYTVNLKKPRNGQWWNWASYGFTGIPTTNCANSGSYDYAGGNTESLNAVTVENIFSGSTTYDELGGSYITNSVQNCNCGSFNCKTNCNCNCACACACACACEGG